MQKSCKFSTGSQYEGFYNTSLHCMEGFGRYLYPDGSEYRGYFKRGKFHGFGRIRLAPPYRFTFVGEFEDGELIQLDELIYPDGLQLFASVTPDGLNTDEWQYCTARDRRYPNEICFGLDAVSPLSTETRMRPPRFLPPGSFDKEEGIYIPTTGFLTHIPTPFFKNRFVGCNQELKWIKKCCRRSTSIANPVPIHPDADIGRRIIDTNIRSMIELGAGVHGCPCGPGPAGTKPTPKWCKGMYSEIHLHNSDQPSSENDQYTECHSVPSSSSKTSCMRETLFVDLSERCGEAIATLKIADSIHSDT